jgi:hypothetical protein
VQYRTPPQAIEPFKKIWIVIEGKPLSFSIIKKMSPMDVGRPLHSLQEKDVKNPSTPGNNGAGSESPA